MKRFNKRNRNRRGLDSRLLRYLRAKADFAYRVVEKTSGFVVMKEDVDKASNDVRQVGDGFETEAAASAYCDERKRQFVLDELNDLRCACHRPSKTLFKLL